jgi:hypothetical protein
MKSTHRRIFMMRTLAGALALGTASARAQSSGPKLEEGDPQAIALGYKQDTGKVDSTKYPKHVASQDCAGCQLFQGKPGDAGGGCPLFAGKQVAAHGWCSAWAKKSG